MALDKHRRPAGHGAPTTKAEVGLIVPRTTHRIADPVERAARAQELVESLREAIGAAEQVRDAAIREARALPGRPTVDALAQAIGCRRNVIVDATRKRNGGA